MKTATVTWITYENYGTDLQAYALQQAIIKLGHSNAILSDSYYVHNFPPKKTLKDYFVNIVRFFKGTYIPPSSKLYHMFRRKFLNIDFCCDNIDSVNKKYDVFVCGSDQIWSPYLEFEPYYYLAFTEKKKIAYAPSLGTGTCSVEYKRNVKSLIERFDYVSVREQSGANLLKSFINKNIQCVVDPTLLLTCEEWNKLIITKKISEKYLICYFLTNNKWYVDYARKYADKHNLKLYIFGTNRAYKLIADRIICAGPQEFLSYIKNADKVFTDSYHASIFSILFNRSFVTFKRFEDGNVNDQNARIYNLFEKLGINDHFVGESDLSCVEDILEPQWVDVSLNITNLREASMSYLKMALD